MGRAGPEFLTWSAWIGGDSGGTPAPRTLGAGSVLPELIAVVEGSRGAWGHGGAACAFVRRVAAATARRGETDPRRAGGGGRTVPAVDQGPGAGRHSHRPQRHRRAVGGCAGPGRIDGRVVRRGGTGQGSACASIGGGPRRGAVAAGGGD